MTSLEQSIPWRTAKLLILMAFLLLICACKTELYSDLQEKEANDMLALLLENGINCIKVPGKEKNWILQVEKNDIARAVSLLRDAGYPKDRYVSMGEVFKKEGLVSSPMEERIRFIFALSQEISETLSQIDGVLSARVHIVIPDNNPLNEKIQPSSASVFIKHIRNSVVESSIPRIKKLVVNSIEGLAYDKVTVVLFASDRDPQLDTRFNYKMVWGIRLDPNDAFRFRMIVGILAGVSVFFLACLAYVSIRVLKKKKPVENA